MSKLQIGNHFSVSLAHKYWVNAFSNDKNQELFGELSSPQGLGHNFDVSLFFSSQMDQKRQLALVSQIKNHWDHQAFLDLGDRESSSLEVLLWKLIQTYGSDLEEVFVQESEAMGLKWVSSSPQVFTLKVSQYVSVLWKQGGGSRIKLVFNFKGPFHPDSHVLIPRKILFETLNNSLRQKEEQGFQLSLEVKENEQILDALLKEIKNQIPYLDSLECEIENQKKWLIHTVNQTR